MTSHPHAEPTWKVSSRCNNGSCVAVAMLPGGRVAVRDTKQSDGSILSFSGEEWTAFLERVKRG